MNESTQNPFASNSGSGEAPGFEETLRLIANLPAPQGLEERVQAGLLAQPRKGRILAWPAALKPDSNWMRSAAAAAIVFVVAGGGWGVYSHVRPPQSAGAMAMPAHAAEPGGFASAGAMRTPQALKGPVLAQPAAVKPAASSAKKALRRGKAARAGKTELAATTVK
jgi:hypothetical protein